MFYFRLGSKVYGKDEGQDRKNGGRHAVQKVQEKRPHVPDVVFGHDARPKSPRETGFKDRVQYEVLIEYNLALINRPYKYQRIGVKSWTDMEEALPDIIKLIKLLNNISSDGASKGDKVVRVIGIYEHDAFKDWTNNSTNLVDSATAKRHIKEAIDLGKRVSKGKKQKPISFVKEEVLKVR